MPFDRPSPTTDGAGNTSNGSSNAGRRKERTMRRIGDALRGGLPARPVGPVASATETALECPICRGAGWLRMSLPVGHPMFGRAIMCECLQAQTETKQFDELLRLSALDAFRDW